MIALQRESTCPSLVQRPPARRGRGWPTIELLPHLALGGLQLYLPSEVSSHLPVVGERRVDGKLSLCGLQMKGNAAFTWGKERQHQHENLGLRQTWSMPGEQAARQGLTDTPFRSMPQQQGANVSSLTGKRTLYRSMWEERNQILENPSQKQH